MYSELIDIIGGIILTFIATVAGVRWLSIRHIPLADVPDNQLSSVSDADELANYRAYLDSEYDWPTWNSLKS